MILARPHILIKVTFMKHFALEVWVSIYVQACKKNEKLLKFSLTHSIASLWGMGKPCRLSSDATERGVSSGSPLFASILPEYFIKICIKMKNTTKQPLKGEWTGSNDKNGKLHSAK